LIAWTIAAPLVPILDPVTNASYICDATPATAQISLALCWLLIAVNLGITVFGAYMAVIFFFFFLFLFPLFLLFFFFFLFSFSFLFFFFQFNIPI